MNPYIGHETQVYGIEEHRLVGGKGDGMRLLEATNGKGLEITVSLDRAGDISRLRYEGINMSYFSPCGYVAPTYYERSGTNWINSFTAGFLTTCGLQAVGTPCMDDGEELPLHGSIANYPVDQAYWMEKEKNLIIHTVVKDETLFGRKWKLTRELCISLEKNEFEIRDCIENTGDCVQPLEILYHINIGYPLLDEESVIRIPSNHIEPRNAHAAEDMENWMKIEKPQAGYIERCYYHKFDQEGKAAIYQPKIQKGLEILFDPKELDGFVEWKMMGVRDYVLGLECGNCYPDGRDVMRKIGMLKFLNPGEEKEYTVRIRMLNESIK